MSLYVRYTNRGAHHWENRPDQKKILDHKSEWKIRQIFSFVNTVTRYTLSFCCSRQQQTMRYTNNQKTKQGSKIQYVTMQRDTEVKTRWNSNGVKDSWKGEVTRWAQRSGGEALQRAGGRIYLILLTHRQEADIYLWWRTGGHILPIWLCERVCVNIQWYTAYHQSLSQRAHTHTQASDMQSSFSFLDGKWSKKVSKKLHLF